MPFAYVIEGNKSGIIAVAARRERARERAREYLRMQSGNQDVVIKERHKNEISYFDTDYDGDALWAKVTRRNME